jgi:uncharacterized protein with NAD-binding domain and iron-sulfur cluster
MNRSDPRHALVVGAGIAGLTAAVTLARAGAQVTVLEAGTVAGGRVATHRNFRLDDWEFPIDHGVHGVWHRYANFRRLLASTRARNVLRAVETTDFVAPLPNGRLGTVDVGRRVRQSRLPALLSPMALLNERDFLRAVLADRPLYYPALVADLREVFAYDPRHSARWDETSVAAFISAWPRYAQDLLRSMTHTGFFAEPHEVSLAALFTGLYHYLIADKHDSAYDVPTAGAHDGFVAPLLATLAKHGGRLELRSRLQALDGDGDGSVRAAVVRRPGHLDRSDSERSDLITADAFVLALDPAGMAALLEDPATQRLVGPIVVPGVVPSLSVRLWFRRTPRHGAPCGVLGGLWADAYFWLDRLMEPFEEFRRATGGSVLELHLYGDAARRGARLEDEPLLVEAEQLARRIWPELDGKLRAADVQRNPATHPVFSTGVFSRLPKVETHAPNLALCGDWIDCPDGVLYMERACTTGLIAARAVASHLDLGLDTLPEPIRQRAPALSIRAARAVMQRVRQGLG